MKHAQDKMLAISKTSNKGNIHFLVQVEITLVQTQRPDVIDLTLPHFAPWQGTVSCQNLHFLKAFVTGITTVTGKPNSTLPWRASLGVGQTLKVVSQSTTAFWFSFQNRLLEVLQLRQKLYCLEVILVRWCLFLWSKCQKYSKIKGFEIFLCW